MAPYAHDPVLDPEWIQIAAALPYAMPTGNDIDFVVAQTRELAKLTGPFNRSIYEPQLPLEGGDIPVRVTIPRSGEGESFPLLVYYHGGCFWACDIDFKDYMLRVLTHKLNIVTVNVGYRTEPYPLPHEDSYTALRWAAENCAKLSADVRKGFIVMGSSAGGTLAAVMAQRARDDPFFMSRPLTGQVLQIPAVCHFDHYPKQYKDRLLSLEQNQNAPQLNKHFLQLIYRWLNGDPTSPSISPLLAPSLAGLPRTLIQVAGFDPLRDEGILYSDLLLEAGVETRLEIYPGVPHGFEELMYQTKKGKKYEKDAEDAIQWMINAV
ncbi:Alpha/Beta hydrolase protein [Vararia minispora EC-137]|uniref:Alpha/Beta hydrolase protein n=1 Tax=Vararia minispora EC-137 TaxID=1314806 RepID=A0ACB8QLH4_9AGAM|nr:Alpha/Beta hydrolase protein [Vararia minispora EC-137]